MHIFLPGSTSRRGTWTSSSENPQHPAPLEVPWTNQLDHQVMAQVSTPAVFSGYIVFTKIPHRALIPLQLKVHHTVRWHDQPFITAASALVEKGPFTYIVADQECHIGAK